MAAQGASAGPPAARVLPRRLFYGWYVAAGCAVLMFVGVGVGYYGLAVFLRPLREEHGWTTTQVSWAPAIYFFIAGLTAAFIGPRIDRHGPKRYLLIGTLLNGVSATFVGIVNELWQLYAVYFFFAMAYGMSASVAVNAIVTRWFVRKRALATSISSTGVSLGGVVLAPLASWLIDVGGLELATPLLGALILAAGVPVVLLVIHWEPASMGLRPDGATGEPPPAKNARVASFADDRVQLRRWTQREAMSTVAFWAVLIAFVLVLIAQTGYIIHQVSFLEDRFGSRSEAAFTISLTAGGSVVARLVVGLFADGLDRRWTSAVLFVVQATCVLLIVHIDNVASTWVLTLLFGFTIGNVYMMQSLLVGEIFGMVSFGAVFGLIAMAGQASSGIGPIGVGWLHDLSGGYTVPFTVTAAITYAAAVVVLFARPPQPAREPVVEADRAAAPAGAVAGGSC
jgi:sugar phosphate permease